MAGWQKPMHVPPLLAEEVAVLPLLPDVAVAAVAVAVVARVPALEVPDDVAAEWLEVAPELLDAEEPGDPPLVDPEEVAPEVIPLDPPAPEEVSAAPEV